MEYNITLRGRGGKWKLLHTTESGSMVIISKADDVITIDPGSIAYTSEVYVIGLIFLLAQNQKLMLCLK